MRTVVTGAAGFIGAEVVRALLAAGHEVFAICRPATGRDRLRERVGERLGQAVLLPLDLNDEGQMQRALSEVRPHAVFHMAWYAHPSDYLTGEENRRSLAMTQSLARAAFSLGCRKLIAAGTCLEYAASKTLRCEDDATAAVSLYAECKLAAWRELSQLATAAGAELAWGRIFHLHGPNEHPARLLPWLVRELLRGQSVDLTDGTQVRDHLHVADVAAAFVALLSPGVSGVYNICSGQPVTLRQVLTTLVAVVGGDDRLRFGARPQRPGEVMFLAGDPTRLHRLGFRPRYTLEDGLADAAAGYMRAAEGEAGSVGA